MAQNRFFSVEQRGDAIIAEIVESQLQGETMAEFLKLELLQIVESRSPQVVIISFRNVKIVSTSIVSFLIYANKRFSGMGIPLKLGAMSDSLRHIFQTLRLDGSVFSIYPTVEEALSSHVGPVTYGDVCERPTPFDPDESD